MSAFIDVCGNETGSPSISKADDNLSNSEGPLIKRTFCGNSNNAHHISSENINGPIGPKMLLTNPKSTKKRYCLWTLTLVLAIIGLCNLFLSITVIAVLRVSQGMEAIEVIPDESLVKFYGRTDLDKVHLQSGVCQGYGDEPMEISGDDASVHIEVKKLGTHETAHSHLEISKNGTSVSQVKSFEVKDPNTEEVYFSTDFPNFDLPSGVDMIDVKITETHRITSPVNDSLTIKSDQNITMKGVEGARIESKKIEWSANSDIFLKSINGNIVLDAKNGIILDIGKIPIATFPPNSDQTNQYKVCVCMPQGKLFTIRVSSDSNHPAACDNQSWSAEDDPCLR